MRWTEEASCDVIVLGFPTLLLVIFGVTLPFFPCRQMALLGKVVRCWETGGERSLRKRTLDEGKRVDQDRGVLDAVLSLSKGAAPCAQWRLRRVLPFTVVVVRPRQLESHCLLISPRTRLRAIRHQGLLRN